MLADGSASSSPTMRKVCTRPSFRFTVTVVCPNDGSRQTRMAHHGQSGRSKFLVATGGEADIGWRLSPLRSDPSKALLLPGDLVNCLLFGLADGKYRKQLLVSKRPGKAFAESIYVRSRNALCFLRRAAGVKTNWGGCLEGRQNVCL